MLDSTSFDLADLQVLRGWYKGDGLLPAVRQVFTYGPGEDRATGYLCGDGVGWAEPLDTFGPDLLAALKVEFGVQFTHVAFQAYRNGSGCDWHADAAFDVQAILSLGVTRTFGLRDAVTLVPQWMSMHHGDLLYMPSGFQEHWEHCVPSEDVPGERVSLVFRTPRG